MSSLFLIGSVLLIGYPPFWQSITQRAEHYNRSVVLCGEGNILSQNVSLQDTGDDGQTHDYEYFISV